jgi:DtxR family transcriptional regulator, Mn-dependent transcriptional regulator
MAAALQPDPSNAVQDYAKAIFSLSRRGEEPVSTSALSDRMGVSAASASAMVRRLAELGLARHEPYRGVELTPSGERVALEVIRHHRLIELYLAEALGIPWDQVHDEAEVLEHAVSPRVAERMAEMLGDPTHDPHGDPIPTREGHMEEGETVSLEDLGPGDGGRFTRVSDEDSDMLRYLAERGITPGTRLEVVERLPFGGPLFVRFGSEVHPIGGDLSRAMRVERAA